jgi:hypothetical protein
MDGINRIYAHPTSGGDPWCGGIAPPGGHERLSLGQGRCAALVVGCRVVPVQCSGVGVAYSRRSRLSP